MSQYTGFQPNNVWSGSKHLETHEYVNVPIVAVVHWTTNGRDAGEEPVAVCLVFGAFSRGFPRGCLIHRHRQLAAFERAAARRLFKGHAGLDLGLSSYVSLPWSVMQLKVWGGYPMGCWLIPVTHHQCQATPIEVHCFSPLLPTLCALSLLFSCVTFSRLRSSSHAKCTLLL